MEAPVSTPEAASPLQADLLAKSLNITAYPAQGELYVSAVCENLGPGRASGPFSIAISVDVRNAADGSLRASYVENFEVPQNVSLAGGPPVFAPPDLAARGTELEARRLPIGVGSVFQTQYVTGNMRIPLYFRDVEPYTVYTAEFLVDPYYEVPDPNRWNNSYSWPGTFWWLSPAARERRGALVIEHAEQPAVLS